MNKRRMLLYCFSVYVCVCVFETGTHSLEQAGPELIITIGLAFMITVQPQHPECGGDRCGPSGP